MRYLCSRGPTHGASVTTKSSQNRRSRGWSGVSSARPSSGGHRTPIPSLRALRHRNASDESAALANPAARGGDPYTGFGGLLHHHQPGAGDQQRAARLHSESFGHGRGGRNRASSEARAGGRPGDHSWNSAVRRVLPLPARPFRLVPVSGDQSRAPHRGIGRRHAGLRRRGAGRPERDHGGDRRVLLPCVHERPLRGALPVGRYRGHRSRGGTQPGGDSARR